MPHNIDDNKYIHRIDENKKEYAYTMELYIGSTTRGAKKNIFTAKQLTNI